MCTSNVSNVIYHKFSHGAAFYTLNGRNVNVMLELFLSPNVAVTQWITSCHNNRMATGVITLWRERVASLTTSVSTMRFLIEIIFILMAIKSRFKGSYDKQNLTPVVISYKIYETRRWLVS